MTKATRKHRPVHTMRVESCGEQYDVMVHIDFDALALNLARHALGNAKNRASTSIAAGAVVGTLVKVERPVPPIKPDFQE